VQASPSALSWATYVRLVWLWPSVRSVDDNGEMDDIGGGERERRRSWRYNFNVSLLVVALALVIVAAMVGLPRLVVQQDLNGASVGVPEQLKALNDARVTTLQAIGGFALIVGAYATWRRLRINEEELRTTRDAQITDRFGRSIEQIGSADPDIRVGGIYGLERIARHSPSDRDAIVATLSALVRRRSSRRDQVADSSPSTLASRASDVQAAITVLGRIPRNGLFEQIRIPRADLRNARLWGLDFSSALMGHADLEGSRLWGSSLAGADLGAAILRNADLSRTNLTNAWLVGADLREAKLTNADLTGAMADEATEWPDDVELSSRGVRILSDAEKLNVIQQRDVSRGRLPR
jgi:hypothetical protein